MIFIMIINVNFKDSIYVYVTKKKNMTKIDCVFKKDIMKCLKFINVDQLFISVLVWYITDKNVYQINMNVYANGEDVKYKKNIIAYVMFFV